ncbi:unnamed protein product [Leuciscus chuanchicus]
MDSKPPSSSTSSSSTTTNQLHHLYSLFPPSDGSRNAFTSCTLEHSRKNADAFKPGCDKLSIGYGSQLCSINGSWSPVVRHSYSSGDFLYRLIREQQDSLVPLLYQTTEGEIGVEGQTTYGRRERD